MRLRRARSLVAAWLVVLVTAAVANACDPSALRRLRFNLRIEASQPFQHVSLMMDAVNEGIDPVDLAGVRFTVSLDFRVGTTRTSSVVEFREQQQQDLKWVHSPSQEFRSFCLYGEMVRSSAPGDGDVNDGGEEKGTVAGWRDGENVCDKAVRVLVDDFGVHFRFEDERDDETVIPLCGGCHFGGSFSGREGVHGMVYHEAGGSLDVGSLLRTPPVVSCRGSEVPEAKVEVEAVSYTHLTLPTILLV